MTERIVGIDFGTSTSVIRVKRYEDGVPIGDANLVMPVTFNMGSTVVPTLIKETSSGKSYGYDAQIPKRNSTTYQNFKVDLESTDTEKKEEARKLTRDFFTYLAKVYNEQSDGGYLGDSTDKVRTLISYPVKWSDETKKFMIDTAKEAGFVNVEGMDEAQAAISAVLVQNADHFEKYGYLDKAQSVNVMLIDMGAGTTDLVLCKYYIKEKKTEIICTWPKEGNILFGGKEVDEILRGYVRSKIPEEESEAILRRCGLEKFKAWKENFISPALKNNESVDEFSELDMLIDMMGTEVEDYTVNRTVFEEQAKDYLGRFTTLINGCIEESKTDAGDIDLVILTGGHSQWYFAEEIISGKTKTFGEVNLKKIVDDNNRIIPIVRPQETVAMGLVYSKLKQEAVKVSEKEPKFPVGRDCTEMIAKGVLQLEGRNRFAVMTSVPENIVVGIGDFIEIHRGNIKVDTGRIKGIAKGPDNIKKAYPGDEIVILFEGIENISQNDVLLVKKMTSSEGQTVGVGKNINNNDFTFVKKATPPRTVNKVSVSVAAYPTDGGTVSGAGSYSLGSVVKLTAVPEDGYEFVGWDNGSTYPTITLKVTGNISYVARFEIKAPEITPAEEFELDSVKGNYRIRKYIGNRTHVVIPEEIKGRKVVAIGKDAFTSASNNSMHINSSLFKSNKTLISVTIPDSVVEIGQGAFFNCYNLEKIKMGRWIVNIGNSAFANCRSLKNIDFGDAIKVIPNGVCLNCLNLESVRISASIEKIGEQAFCCCKNLLYLNFGSDNNAPGEVHFPRNLKSIGTDAFIKNTITGNCIFKEIMLSKKTVIKNNFVYKATFSREIFKNCAVFYYED